jgi:aspartate 1-decarboxylase
MRMMLKGKIHRATVTEANVDYEGSITIDPRLMDAAGIVQWEQVHVLDVNNGSRLTTYAIEGEAGSGVICMNGAAARLIHEGDLVIILAYDMLTQEEARDHKPRLVYVNERNEIVRTAREIPVGVH